MKTCTKCNNEKDDSSFYKQETSRDGLNAWCKECQAEYNKEYRRVPVNKDSQLKSKYGISLAEAQQMYDLQKGKCAICGEFKSLFAHSEGLYIDHSHDTGSVRGLLCHSCNLGIGHFKDNEQLLANAIEYLKKHKAQTNPG